MDFRGEYEQFIPENADHKYFRYMNRAGDAMLTVHPEIRTEVFEGISYAYVQWAKERERCLLSPLGPRSHRTYLKDIKVERDGCLAHHISEAHKQEKYLGQEIRERDAEAREREAWERHEQNLNMQSIRMRGRGDDRRDR
jgi:hypothetical protein